MRSSGKDGRNKHRRFLEVSRTRISRIPMPPGIQAKAKMDGNNCRLARALFFMKGADEHR